MEILYDKDDPAEPESAGRPDEHILKRKSTGQEFEIGMKLYELRRAKSNHKAQAHE